MITELVVRGFTPQEIIERIEEMDLLTSIDDVEPGTQFWINNPEELDGSTGLYVKLATGTHLPHGNVYCANLDTGKVWQGDVANGIEVKE